MTWHHTHDHAARALLEAIRPKMPLCPSWCAESHADLIDAVDVAGRYLAHFHRSAPVTIAAESGESASVYVERFEHVDFDGTTDPTHRMVVGLDYNGAAGFTASQARQVAAAILDAADEVDKLT